MFLGAEGLPVKGMEFVLNLKVAQYEVLIMLILQQWFLK